MNLKFETIVKILRKVMKLNAVILLKSTNEYNRKIITESGRKMDLYPALFELLSCLELFLQPRGAWPPTPTITLLPCVAFRHGYQVAGCVNLIW